MNDALKHTTLDLLRHGELDIPGIFCAPADAIVSKTGMDNLFKATDKQQWDVIISSPHNRCRIFSETLAQKNQTELSIDPRFKELDFGDWVGMKSDVIWKQNKNKYQELWQTPDDFIAPNGEAMRDFYSRVQTGLKDVLAEYKNQSILLVTHGGVIRSILSKALDIDSLSVLKFNIEYAHLTRLHYYADDQFSLQFLGKNR